MLSGLGSSALFWNIEAKLSASHTDSTIYCTKSLSKEEKPFLSLSANTVPLA